MASSGVRIECILCACAAKRAKNSGFWGQINGKWPQTILVIFLNESNPPNYGAPNHRLAPPFGEFFLTLYIGIYMAKLTSLSG